jgi:AAA domain/RepB DNA-primase from phage plasmid
LHKQAARASGGGTTRKEYLVSASEKALYKAQDLWHHVFGDERGLLAVCHSDGANFRTHYFNYPTAADSAAEWVNEKAQEGHEAYFCAHLLRAARRIKENATQVRTLWGDLDGAKVPEDKFAPTAVVQSSPGRFHCYWRLADPIPPESAELLNKRLAEEIGADSSGFDLTQLLRVPGTANHKYEGRPVVGIEHLDTSHAYSAGDLDRALPPLSEAPSQNGHAPESSGDDPPVVLGPEALKVWRGEKPKIKDDGGVDRSTSLLKIGRVIYDAGATGPTVAEALKERDLTLGWKCYTDRRDADKQYQAIVGLLEKEGRNQTTNLDLDGRSRSRSRIDQDQEDRGVKNPKNSLRAVSFTGEPKPPPRQFVVEGIVPAGAPTIVYGPSGIAKSFNILHLSLSVAFVGLDSWHGRRIMTCPVIYLDFEMERVEQLRRAQEVARGAGWPDVPKNFWYVNALGHSAAEVFDFAVEQLQDLGEALVVIDSFGFALAGESERSADVLAFMREHVGVLQTAGGHPLIVDHVARLVRGERSSNQDAFGSIYKKNAARSNIHVTGHQEEDSSHVYTTFTHKNTNLGPTAAPFTVVTKFAAEEVVFELSDEVVKPPAPESTADLIIAAIQEYGPMTNKEIAGTTDRPYKTVQNVTKELKDGGVLRTTEEKRDGAPILDLAGA